MAGQPAQERTDEWAEPAEDPELLAAATPEEMADGTENGQSEGEPVEENAASKMRIEIQTQDPNVRIIWFTPAAAEAAAPEKDN